MVARAGGNPLYAEQYARMVAERAEREAMPETVHGIIAARLDALSREEKSLLQDAAVVGKDFLARCDRGDRSPPSDSDAVLPRARAKEFVQRRRRSAVAREAEYSFRHVLLRDVAYAQIPARGTRREAPTGGRVDRVARAPGRPRGDDRPPLLQALEYAHATASDRAALVERAQRAAREAGDRAMSMGAFATAARFYAKALELSRRTTPERPRLLLGRGRALFFSERSGLELLTEVLDTFRAAGDLEGAAEAATSAARAMWSGGGPKGTDAYMELALDLLAKRPPSAATARALVARRWLPHARGSSRPRFGSPEKRFPLQSGFGLAAQRARALMIIGASRVDRGDAAGIHDIERSIEVARDAGSFEMVARDTRTSSPSSSSSDGSERPLRPALPCETCTSGPHRLGSAHPHSQSKRARPSCAAIGTRHCRSSTASSRRRTPGVRTTRIRCASRFEPPSVPAAANSPRRRRMASGPWSWRAGRTRRHRRRRLLGGHWWRWPRSSRGGRGARPRSSSRWALSCYLRCARHTRHLQRSPGCCATSSSVTNSSPCSTTPLASPWVETGRAIAAGDLVQAAEILAELGHGACAAYASLRLAESLRAASSKADGNVHLARALDFYRRAGRPITC